jgi:hypothetical protein
MGLDFVESIKMVGRAMLAISTVWIIWKMDNSKQIENYETFIYGMLMGLVLRG